MARSREADRAAGNTKREGSEDDAGDLLAQIALDRSTDRQFGPCQPPGGGSIKTRGEFFAGGSDARRQRRQGDGGTT
jgi:hypothetical protein